MSFYFTMQKRIFTIRNFYQAESAEAGWSRNEQESIGRAAPTLLTPGFCDPSRQEALGTRSQPSKRRSSLNQLPVLRWHTKGAMPGCNTKTKRRQSASKALAGSTAIAVEGLARGGASHPRMSQRHAKKGGFRRA